MAVMAVMAGLVTASRVYFRRLAALMMQTSVEPSSHAIHVLRDSKKAWMPGPRRTRPGMTSRARGACMTTGYALRKWARNSIWCTIAGLFLLAGVAAHAQVQSSVPSLEQIKASLDEIEAAVGRDDTTAEALAGLRGSLNSATDGLRGAIDELEPRAHDIEERLKQLGPAPGKDAPPETAEIAKEREELTTSFRNVDGA